MITNPPQQFGRYEILGPLDGRPAGAVAREPDTGRTVWIDIISPGPGVLDDARRTATQINAAGDRRLIAPHDFLQDDGRVGVVTHAPAATLADLMRGGERFPVHVAARRGYEIAEAMAAAHGLGILHGALTPHAVVEQTDGTMALQGFGFARDPAAVVDASTWTAYAAPEQIGGGGPDEKTDLYALGGLLTLMLTGRPPFEEFDQAALARRKLDQDAPMVSRVEPLVPPALDAFIAQLLSRDPSQRPDSAAAAARELAKFTEAVTPAPVQTVAPLVVPVQTERPRPVWPWLVGALAVLTALVIAFVVAENDDDNRVVVPNVVGQSGAVATRLLTQEGFSVSSVTVPDATVPAGSVISQSPLAGARARPQRTVTITVSAPVATPVTPAPPVVVIPRSDVTTTTTSTTTSTTTTTLPLPPPST